jgi:Fe-S cluster assembly protein SufD
MRFEHVIADTEKLQSYLDIFPGFEKRSAGHALPWLQAMREAAFERFCQTGFPTTHDEDWRFTNVSAIANTAFELAPPAKVTAEDLSAYRQPPSACRLVFVNGRFSKELSSTGNLPRGLQLGSLAEKLAAAPDELEPHLGRYLDTARDAFAALNTAFLDDGAWVHIARGAVLEHPIFLLFVSTHAVRPAMTHPRNLVVAGQGSQATIIEDYVSLGGGTVLSNAATELFAGDNATITHLMIEREHEQAFNISTLRIEQGRDANVASHSLLLGGALVRNNVHPVLRGQGGECLINGLFIGHGRQHMDNYMLVEHASPHCGSRQFYNGILDDQAHGVFHGRIVVHKDAQKTDAKQTNRNLLLSDDAQIDTKPQLEIYADDVKCTHGATIGQIEEDSLFYLRSRGLDERTARKLLLYAFASECLDRIKEGPARDQVERLVDERLFLGGFASARERSAATSNGRNWEEIG